MTNNTIEEVAGQATGLVRTGLWRRQTPAFLTLVNIFVLTAALFAVVMANSVLLGREQTSSETYASLAIVSIALSAVMVINVCLHFFFGRFDTENRTQRHWIAGTALLLAVGMHVHNIFWFVNAHYDPSNFPQPNYASYSIVGFLFCFFSAIHGWYQLKFANRLFV